MFNITRFIFALEITNKKAGTFDIVVLHQGKCYTRMIKFNTRMIKLSYATLDFILLSQGLFINSLNPFKTL